MLSPSFSLPAIWYMASRKHSHVISYVPTTDRFPCGIGKRNPKIVGLFYQLTAKPKAFRAVLTTDGPCVYFHFCMMCAFRNNSSVMTITTIFNRKLYPDNPFYLKPIYSVHWSKIAKLWNVKLAYWRNRTPIGSDDKSTSS